MAQTVNGLVSVPRDEVVLLLEAGWLLMDMSKFKEAREVFDGAAALLPKSEAPLLALGSLEFAQGKHDKALQAYRKAQALAPKSGLPRAHAGEALLFLGKFNEAAKELNEAIRIEPKGDGARLAQALLEAKDAGAFDAKKKGK